ncbi:hypothetical protein J7T55_007103 [Diaporthe amygdali]|uniref:uncharacterized protein n=1 Tax=Phomopsis amygdali TaxID=1214568 RepID=UPI0022FDE8BC|nr:uncharacterized protein J7T55_007103 [Diaporthe amygdali]KAJ0107891.1 hypothetical protein J7T55_007103 [Diaporthe amygdali]
MGSLSFEDPEPLTARAVQGVVEVVGTGIVQSGVPTDATSRTSLDSTRSFPGTVEDLGCDEFLVVGESKDLPYPNLSSGLDPPLLSPSSINSGVFHEGLNRLHSFQDLARLRLKHATQIECYEANILQIPETDSELYDLRDRRWAHLEFSEDEGGDDLGADLSGTESPLSSSPSTTSTFLDCQPPTERRPFSFEAFFDASPESPEGSPTLPRRTREPRHITYRSMPPKTMPELSGLGDSGEGSAFLSSTWASSNGGIAAAPHHAHQQHHLRPRSAPKNLARSSNPFTGFWGRKHQQQQDDVLVGKLADGGLDSGSVGKRISDDGTAVEVHEGRTTPPRSASGTPNGLKDAKEPANASEGGGPPPLTREEFEALPLAIQRKLSGAGGVAMEPHFQPPDVEALPSRQHVQPALVFFFLRGPTFQCSEASIPVFIGFPFPAQPLLLLPVIPPPKQALVSRRRAPNWKSAKSRRMIVYQPVTWAAQWHGMDTHMPSQHRQMNTASALILRNSVEIGREEAKHQERAEDPLTARQGPGYGGHSAFEDGED